MLQTTLGTKARATVPHLRRSEGWDSPGQLIQLRGNAPNWNSLQHVHHIHTTRLGAVGKGPAALVLWDKHAHWTSGQSSPPLRAFRKTSDLFVLRILMRHHLSFLDTRIGVSVMLGSNHIRVAINGEVKGTCAKTLAQERYLSSLYSHFRVLGPLLFSLALHFFHFLHNT